MAPFLPYPPVNDDMYVDGQSCEMCAYSVTTATEIITVYTPQMKHLQISLLCLLFNV